MLVLLHSLVQRFGSGIRLERHLDSIAAIGAHDGFAEHGRPDFHHQIATRAEKTNGGHKGRDRRAAGLPHYSPNIAGNTFTDNSPSFRLF